VRLLPRRRVRPRTACIALLTLAFAAVVVLPEALSASGLTAVHRQPTVPNGLDARRAVVLRPNRVDLVEGRTVVASMPYNGTNVTLAGLTRAIAAPEYLSQSRGTVVVKAAIVQRPGTSLTVGPDGVRTVRIRTAPGATAYFWGTSARLTLDGVTVGGTSRIRSSARAYLRYTGDSSVTVTNTRFSGLGRPGRHRIGALDLGRGTRASVTGSTFSAVDTGIVAHRTASVSLRNVTVTGAAGDGIAFLDAGTVDASRLTVTRGHRNGLVVSGRHTLIRALHDVTASANGHAGLMVTGGADAVVARLHTAHNGNAGTVLRAAGRVGLADGTSASEPTGVRVQDGVTTTVTNLRATGDTTGISADGKSGRLVVHGGTIRGAKVGLRVQTPGAVVSRLTVQDSDIGVESGARANRFQALGVTVTSAAHETGTGLVVGGGSAAVSNVSISGPHTGLRIEGRDAVVTDTTVNAAGSGLLLSATATGAQLHGVHVFGADEGVRMAAGADRADIVDSTIGGGNGLRIGADDVTVTGGSVQATSSAVVVDSSAGGVTFTGTGVHGTLEGIRMTAATGELTLDAVQVTGAARGAVELDGGTTTVHGSTLQSGGTVVDAGAELHLDTSTVTGPIGVRVAEGVTGTVSDTRVQGGDIGVFAVPGSRVTLSASRIYGAVPVHGSATVDGHSFVAAMPLNWLGIAGIALVVIAVLLMLAARVRERDHDHVSLAPAHVVNRA